MSSVETMSSTANGSTTPTRRTGIPQVVRVTLPPGRSVRPRIIWDSNDSHLIALFSFLIGIVLAGSIAGALFFPSTLQCWLYITFLCIFHFLEYYITAKYKPFEVTLDGELKPYMSHV
jgi:hypothetical protein